MGFDTAQLEITETPPFIGSDIGTVTTNALDHTSLLTQPLGEPANSSEIVYDPNYVIPGLYAANLTRDGKLYTAGNAELAQINAPQMGVGLFLQSGTLAGVDNAADTSQMSPLMIQLRAHGDTAMAILHNNRSGDIDKAAKAFAFVYNEYDFTIEGNQQDPVAAGRVLNDFTALVLEQIAEGGVNDPMLANFEQSAPLRQLFRGQLNGILNLLNLIAAEGIDSIDEVVGLGESIGNYLEVLVDSEIFVREATDLARGFSVMERLARRLFPQINIELLDASIIDTENIAMSGRFYMNMLNMLSGLDTFRARNVKVYVETTEEGNARVSALYDGDGGEFHNPDKYIHMEETTTGTLGETRFPGLLRNGVIDNAMNFILMAKNSKDYGFVAKLKKQGIDFVAQTGFSIPANLHTRVDNTKFLQYICQFEQSPTDSAYIEP